MKKLVLFSLLLATVLLVAPAREVRSQEEEMNTTTVKLLDAGAEPRVPLRYKFTAGAKEAMVMDMKISMEMTMQGMAQPAMDIPTMRMVMAITSEEVNEDGNCKYVFELTEATVLEAEDADPFMVETMKMGLETTIGMTGWALIDPRGITLDGDFQLPEGADPNMQQSMDSMKQQMSQMSAPFPMEAVGTGASWKVIMPMETNGLSLNQVATYKLVSLNGGVAELEVTLEQTAEQQAMDLPNVPPGVTANLKSLNSTGTGWMTLDLAKLVPITSMELKMSMAMDIVMEGQPAMPMTTDMEMTMKINPGAVTEPSDEEED